VDACFVVGLPGSSFLRFAASTSPARWYLPIGDAVAMYSLHDYRVQPTNQRREWPAPLSVGVGDAVLWALPSRGRTRGRLGRIEWGSGGCSSITASGTNCCNSLLGCVSGRAALEPGGRTACLHESVTACVHEGRRHAQSGRPPSFVTARSRASAGVVLG